MSSVAHPIDAAGSPSDSAASGTPAIGVDGLDSAGPATGGSATVGSDIAASETTGDGGAPVGEGSSDGVVVSPMKRRHLRAVASIEAASNTHPWSRSLFGGELRMPASRHWLVARDAHEVLGFAGLMWTVDEGHITNFAVHPDHRGRGIATRMLLCQCRDAVGLGVQRLTLEVRASNAAAQALYRLFGFAPGGVRRAYYRDNGEDAIIMWAHDLDTRGFEARLARIESALPVALVRDDR